MMNRERFVFLCLYLSERRQLDFEQLNKNTSVKKRAQKQ